MTDFAIMKAHQGTITHQFDAWFYSLVRLFKLPFQALSLIGYVNTEVKRVGLVTKGDFPLLSQGLGLPEASISIIHKVFRCVIHKVL